MEQSKKLPLIIATVVILTALLVTSVYYFTSITKTNNPFMPSSPRPQTVSPTIQPVTLANPASVHCEKIGGTLEMRTNNLGEYGVCKLDGLECEEWALFRGECSLLNTSKIKPSSQSGVNNSLLGNPASQNCENLGGTISIETNGAGDQYGLCNLGSGYTCEEWALYRGDCPNSGVRTIGFDTPAQMYCANLGGQTLAESNAKCTFNDGSVCNDEALYNGHCHKGKY